VADGEAGEDSTLDQSSAGLTRLAEVDQAEFGQLTAAYRDRFGIPLIVCVRDAEAEAILRDGRRRLANSPAQEHAAALIEIARSPTAGSRTRWLRQTPSTAPARRAFGQGEHVSLDSFNALPEAAALARLLGCCAAPRWAGEVAAGRPYRSSRRCNAAALGALTDADLTAGLAGHPRIGDRTGD